MVFKRGPGERPSLGRGAAVAVIAGLCGLGLQPGACQAAHPNALWRVVHDLCVPDRRLTGLSAPCVEVNLTAGYAVVPDPGLATQLLLVPTRRVSGIEDPQLLEPDAPNYWQAAWTARGLLARRVGAAIGREDVAMAVNAIPGRSQEQLHIHLSCLRRDVGEALRTAQPSTGDRWSSLILDGMAWRTRAVAGSDLADADPFKLLAASAPAIAARMGLQTLVVVGAQFSDHSPGFYLLASTVDPATANKGFGEALLDKTCGKVATKSP